MFRLDGKIAWVTGVNPTGIGASIVRALSGAGATVMSTGRRRPEIESTGRIVNEPCDVTKQGDIERIVALCAERFGGLDILVNNAATTRNLEVWDITEEVWDTVLDTNLKACFFCSQAAARQMRAAGRGGSIVNISSVSTDVVRPTGLPYSTSKGGLRSMTYSLSVALGPYDIRVNAVAPGRITTGMNVDRSPEKDAAIASKTPLQRLGKPEDVAPAVVYLASDEARFVTGIVLPIHGGATIRSPYA